VSGAIAFPFSAIVGQEALREALLVSAVDVRIGGVLVRGERGTAKSTAVRAMAPLLPPVEGAAVPLVELPVGATADRLLGSLDVERALRDGEAAFQPGLLAAADGGILYADEVNLLPDHLVDVLLDAAATGRVHIERDGVSAAHDARFLLVGTMNPEEGELRPQLLDRFGLSVEVAASPDARERVEVVRRRMAFDADAAGFVAAWAAAEGAVAARVAAARSALDRIALEDRTLLLIAGVCAELGVDGMRADIVCARAARALAALDGAAVVSEDHVRRAALLALAHRRRRGPLDPPGLSAEELERAMNGARSGADGDGDEPEPPRGPGGGHRGDVDRAADAGGREPAGGGRDSAPGRAKSTTSAHSGTCARFPSDGDGDPAHVGGAQRVEASGAAGLAPALSLDGVGRGAAGRRSRSAGRDGQPVDSRASLAGADVVDLAVAATLRAAAQRGSRQIAARDVREHVRSGREGNLVVFCVDASGSMGARRRMAAVKGAILGLLLDAYRRRDRVALVTFRAERADVVLPPTSGVDRAAAALADLPTGGATPLARGLEQAAALIAAERRRDPDRRALALVVTDGRASGGADGRAAARHAAARLARAADGVVVFDGEEGRVRLGLATELAHAAGARLLPLAALHAPAPERPRRAA
jgi:magnesium chelatase subunit D